MSENLEVSGNPFKSLYLIPGVDTFLVVASEEVCALSRRKHSFESVTALVYHNIPAWSSIEFEVDLLPDYNQIAAADTAKSKQMIVKN